MAQGLQTITDAGLKAVAKCESLRQVHLTQYIRLANTALLSRAMGGIAGH